MPILPTEPALYPENLFDDPEAREDPARRWWVLHARPRQEKSLARQLYGKNLPFYLPLLGRRSKIRGRVFTAQIPLFAGYLFLFGDRDERVIALATGRVVRSLEVPDQAKLWHDLAQVNRLIASGSPITPEEQLEPGTAVEITSGPLAGLRGTILRTKPGRRFVVAVDFIQRGASVELEDVTLVRSAEG